MARLPDLEIFAREHGLKIGTIADLIEHRSRNETLIERVGAAPLTTPQGEFDCIAFRDQAGGLHLALTHGRWAADDEVPVRVHEPFTALDLLDAGGSGHSWPLPRGAGRAARRPLRRGRAAELRRRRRGPAAAAAARRRPRRRARAAQMDLRTYGIGAQILRELGVAPHEAARQPAPHAQHDRLRPRGHRLRRPPDA